MTQRPGEFELIARYFAPLARGFPGAYGLRDDAAVVQSEPGHELVLKTDAIVGGVHFLDSDPPDLVARKALRVNLSDLAAKGACQRAYLLDLMIPGHIDEAWIAAFAAGLAQDQAEYGVHLIGGDTDSTPGPVAVAITALGDVPTGQIIRRGGARAGDELYVTGTVGDGALGLRVATGTLTGIGGEAVRFLVDRYRLPRPRVNVGPLLIGVATGALDVSDGLVADIGHLCKTSGLDAIVEESDVPLSDAARAVLHMQPAAIESVLTGGDDYEIAFAAPAASADRIAAIARKTGVAITRIGRLVAPERGQGGAVQVIDAGGMPRRLASGGWKHF